MSEQTSIGDKVDRIDAIIEGLEDGEVSLEEAKELREEGKEIICELEEMLDVGEGEVREE
jgi:exodeoxyribonuclease VII small subunit